MVTNTSGITQQTPAAAQRASTVGPGSFTSNLVPDLGNQFYLVIDTTWLSQFPGGGVGQGRRSAWASPLGTRLAVTFYDLEDGFEESADVNYADSEVIGRAESFKSYVGNGNRTLPFTFKFQAQGVSNESLQQTLQREVVDPARWLEALKFPYVSDNNLSYPPPRVILHIGSLLQARCICTDATIKWAAPFDPASMLPYAAEVDCTFTVVREKIRNYPFNSLER